MWATRAGCDMACHSCETLRHPLARAVVACEGPMRKGRCRRMSELGTGEGSMQARYSARFGSCKTGMAEQHALRRKYPLGMAYAITAASPNAMA
jgi:hypothetical protein